MRSLSDLLTLAPKEAVTFIKEERLLVGGSRVGQFAGRTLAADFDLTPESVAPFAAKLWSSILDATKRAEVGDKVEMGIYDGDIRVWVVSSV